MLFCRTLLPAAPLIQFIASRPPIRQAPHFFFGQAPPFLIRFPPPSQPNPLIRQISPGRSQAFCARLRVACFNIRPHRRVSLVQPVFPPISASPFHLPPPPPFPRYLIFPPWRPSAFPLLVFFTNPGWWPVFFTLAFLMWLCVCVVLGLLNLPRSPA